MRKTKTTTDSIPPSRAKWERGPRRKGIDQSRSDPQPAMVMARDADQEWSGIWVGLLGFTTVCLFFAAFVAHDLVRNLYEYQSGGTMGSGLVRMLSGMFGG